MKSSRRRTAARGRLPAGLRCRGFEAVGLGVERRRQALFMGVEALRLLLERLSVAARFVGGVALATAFFVGELDVGF